VRKDRRSISSAKILAVVVVPPADEKKSTMAVFVGGVAPVGILADLALIKNPP